MNTFLKSKPSKILCFLLSFLLLTLNLPNISFAHDGGGGGGGDDPDDSCNEDNCGSSCEAENHIVKPSGNLNLTIPMFSLKTKGEPISIYLTYNSQGEMTNGPFGYGWLFPYDIHIDRYHDGGLLIKTIQGGERFPWELHSDNSYQAREEYFSVISPYPLGGYTEEFRDGKKYIYEGVDEGRLVEVQSPNGNTITINRDADDFIETIVGPEGRTIEFIRSGAKIIQIIAPDGGTYDFTYSYGDLVSFSTPEGITTTFDYDSDHMLEEKDTEGRVVEYQYDDEWRVTDRTNENGDTTHYGYDDENHKTIITDPLGNFRTISYDEEGRWLNHRWLTQTELYGQPALIVIKEEQALYGAAGNMISFIDGEDNQTVYNYDENGNRIERIDAAGNPTLWEYDDYNNLIKETDARDNVTEYEYDGIYRNLIKTTWYIEGNPVYESRTYYPPGHPNERLLHTFTNARGFTTTYEEYHASGNPEKITGPLGKETTFTYDIMGRMLTRTEKIDAGASRTTSYEYNDDGRRTKIIYDDGSYEEFHYDCCDMDWMKDRNGIYTYYTYSGTHKRLIEEKGNRLTEYEYDENDNLVKKTVYNEPYNDQITEYSYDAANRLIEVKALGSSMNLITRNVYNGADKIVSREQKLGESWITTTYDYDELNRLTAVHAPLDADTFYEYDANGNRTEIRNPNNQITGFAYDEKNRLISVTNALGIVTEFTLDEVGNRTAVTEAKDAALERTINYEYDALNRLTEVTDPLDNKATLSYDLLGNTLSRTDANWNATTYTYDSNGRIIAKTNAENHTTQYEYDYNGNRIKLTDPKGNWTEFSYNGFNEMIAITYADGSSETYTYDKAANKRSKTTRAGETITFEYDDFNRMVKKTYPDSSETTFAYDQLGRMTSASNNNASYSFDFNDLNQLTEYDVTMGTEQYTVGYEWDKVGNKTSIVYPSGEEYTRGYDDLNRLDQIKQSETILADYDYDELNRRTRLEYDNGTWATYTHNEVDWLENLTNWRSDTDVISTFGYTHDNVGNRTSMTTLDGTHSYGYDKIYELTSADYPDGYPFPDMSYHYDSAWNRTTTINGGTKEYFSNELNQYTEVDGISFDYDLNGNLTDDGEQTYYYDCENQLTKVVRNSDSQILSEYRYDPFGKRIQKIADGKTTNVVYDHTSYQVLAEYEDEGGGFDLSRHFVYGTGIDEPLVMMQNGYLYFYNRDGLGSVTNLTDSDGDTVKEYDYAVYGDFTTSGTLIGNPYTFTGRRYDSESGLFYYRARYYSPVIGCFLQTDPIAYNDGPNLYTYVFNAPVNHKDPMGLSEYIRISLEKDSHNCENGKLVSITIHFSCYYDYPRYVNTVAWSGDVSGSGNESSKVDIQEDDTVLAKVTVIYMDYDEENDTMNVRGATLFDEARKNDQECQESNDYYEDGRGGEGGAGFCPWGIG